jgi:hypothetical protein
MDPKFVTLGLLAVIFLAGTIFGMILERILSYARREAWRAKNHQRGQNEGFTSNVAVGPWNLSRKSSYPKPSDAADQLRIVMRSSFSIQPLLNQGEARLFRELDRAVIACNPHWQVMAQVSLGEIIRSKDAAAHGCINSKRVDLLLVDGDCRPRHAIEYQGHAHHQGNAAARDAVKKEALRRAGIGYHEVVAGHTTPVDLRRLVEKLVDAPAEPELNGSR